MDIKRYEKAERAAPSRLRLICSMGDKVKYATKIIFKFFLGQQIITVSKQTKKF